MRTIAHPTLLTHPINPPPPVANVMSCYQGAIGAIIVDDGQCVAYNQHCLPGADKQRGEGFARLGVSAMHLLIASFQHTISMYLLIHPLTYPMTHPINTLQYIHYLTL